MGGAISVALTAAMVIGIFAGTGMDVRAADTIEKTLNTCTKYDAIWTSLGTGVGTGTKCTIRGKQSSNGNDQQFVGYLCYFSGEVSTANLTSINAIESTIYSNPPIKLIPITDLKSEYSFTVETLGGISKWDMEGVLIADDDAKHYYLFVFLTPAKNSTSESTPSSAEQFDNSTPAPHTHSYSWETVQDVTAEQDGIEEYRCSCGDVQERCVLPRYMAIVKGLCSAVKDAPQNGTATFDTGGAFTMTDYVIRKLSERTDVTTVVTFKYQNQAYRMTIPAGADYTALLSDGDYFYGYFYFANAVGATIEAM